MSSSELRKKVLAGIAGMASKSAGRRIGAALATKRPAPVLDAKSEPPEEDDYLKRLAEMHGG